MVKIKQVILPLKSLNVIWLKNNIDSEKKRKLLNYIKGYTQDEVSEKLPKYPKYFWP